MNKVKFLDRIDYFFQTYGEQIVEAIMFVAMAECVIFYYMYNHFSLDIGRSIMVNIMVAVDAMIFGLRYTDKDYSLQMLEKVNIVLMIVLLILPIWFVFVK